MSSLRPGRVELPREKGARRLQDLVRAAQFAVLALKLLEPLALGARQAIAATAIVGFRLTNPKPQRLAVHAEITRHVRDRPAALEYQPHTTLSELIRILARGWHRRRLSCPQDRSSWLRSLHRTRDGSCGQLGVEVAGAMNAAALAVRGGPTLLDRFD